MAAREQFESKLVWEAPVRFAHWVGAVATSMLIITGFYIGWPIAYGQGEAFDGFLMGRVRQLHFIFAYTFLIAYLLRCYWFLAGNNYARSGFPFIWRREWWRRLIEQVKEYIIIKPGKRYIGHNQLGTLVYAIFIAGMGGCQIVTGFAMYGESNPGGFWDRMFGWVIPLCGGSWELHHWHHLFAWGILIFIALHIYIVIIDSILMGNGLVASIFTGRKFVREGDVDSKAWLS